ncbi:hypothetical protein J22TS3_32370 [Paenibacillus sp. J22TS3]|nr:hypothetical protein J22TS3_32370 [Paenibacillus sp. J22TS3]
MFVNAALRSNGTYIVYKTVEGQVVKEYNNGNIVLVVNSVGSHS